MNKILNCITVGDPDGIGLELIYNIWKFKKNKTGTFFILGNYKIIKKKYSISKNIQIIKIKHPEDSFKYFNKYLPILDIEINDKKYVPLEAIKRSYNLAKLNKIN